MSYSVNTLFYKYNNPESDPRCVIVARLIKEMKIANLEEAQIEAEHHYNLVDVVGKLSLPNVDHRAFTMYQAGISIETTKAYWSLFLSVEDVGKWSIIVCPTM